MHTVSQSTGRCASWLQFQQKLYPHMHAMSKGSADTAVVAPHSAAKRQPGAGHHFTCRGGGGGVAQRWESVRIVKGVSGGG